MPTSEPMTMGEVSRSLDRLEKSISDLAGRVVTKGELDLHFKGLRQQFEAIDNRITSQAAELAEEKKSREEAERKAQAVAGDRAKDRRNLRNAVLLCVLAAALAYLSPLLSPWA
jgi:hypothetical protein